MHFVLDASEQQTLREQSLLVVLRPRKRKALEATAAEEDKPAVDTQQDVEEALALLSDEDDEPAAGNERPLKELTAKQLAKKLQNEKNKQEKKQLKEELARRKKETKTTYALACKASKSLQPVTQALEKALKKPSLAELTKETLQGRLTGLEDWRLKANSAVATHLKDSRSLLPELPFDEARLKDLVSATRTLLKDLRGASTPRAAGSETAGAS